MFEPKDGGKMHPDMKAKMDVIQALRKMAMELIANGHEEGDHEPAAVVAKVDMKKVSPDEAMAEMQQKMSDPGEDMSGKDAEAEDPSAEQHEKSDEEAESTEEKMAEAKDPSLEGQEDDDHHGDGSLKSEMFKRMMQKKKR